MHTPGYADDGVNTNLERLNWSRLPDLPNELGVAGAFVGVHHDALIVAGGANFPEPVWESAKQWTDQISVLRRVDGEFIWKSAGALPRPLAYGAAVSLPEGVLCIGGNDNESVYSEVFLLLWNQQTQKVQTIPLAPLPEPRAYGQAVSIGRVVYLAGGQSGSGLDSAVDSLLAFEFGVDSGPKQGRWKSLPPCPGGPRAFNITAAQHNGYSTCVYIVGGRRQDNERVQFLPDVWEFDPSKEFWRRRCDAPRSTAAGIASPFGQSHLIVLSGADGTLFDRADDLKDEHPGFPKEALCYHTITNTWSSGGAIPQNQVTTSPAVWDGKVIVASGEIRPRVRTPQVWSVSATSRDGRFGATNYAVLVAYLLGIVGVGLYCTRFNESTDDFFRGGKNIPWWATGCSIFATMLSSLTFTGIPAKAYAQDWVYAVGNLMIPVVAVFAVYVALPFFRRLDVTSAYEYLEFRFSRPVRLFGSASFTLFHLFRMAVVMSLTGLALAVATPLTPVQSVLLMGVLSVVYCTFGGIEAVIWTDTIQTFVLFGGALLALTLLVNGTDGGIAGFGQTIFDGDKLRLANFNWDPTRVELAWWVVILGAIGQNVSSYTADQAVVQRYSTTSTELLAARSIWTNAVLTIPATLLFFGIGSALYVYYRSHPERLDPTLNTDQVLPYFIATEMPVGVAGLVVAAIFAAAQSTVSTSMNSIATTVVTDFLRPMRLLSTERDYLTSARWITVVTGLMGTSLGIGFVNPRIQSLFDVFIQVIGLFMGVLGGLFLLGILTKRANSFGAITGAIVGVATMLWLWRYTQVQGYLYTTVGIVSCVVAGYLASFLGLERKSQPAKC